jgi:hypothetical protein
MTGTPVLTEASGSSTRWFRGWLFLPLLPLIGFALFGSTGEDDAYVTYWEAARLVATRRLENYNGRALEQSSSLLHVVLLGGVSWLTRASVPTVGGWFSVALGAACAPIAYRLGGRLEPRSGWIAAAVVATSPPLVYWAFGGLETSLATVVVLLVALSVIRYVGGGSSVAVAALWIFAAALVRPEIGLVLVGAFVLAAVVLWIFPRPRNDEAQRFALRRCLSAAAVAAISVVAIAVFRHFYFGEFFPHPVSMKTGTLNTDGAAYVWTTLWRSAGLGVVAVTAVALLTGRRLRNPAWLIPAAIALVGAVVVVADGGDWMENGRLMVPWLVLSSVVAAAWIATLRLKTIGAWALIALNVAGLASYATFTSQGTAAWAHVVLPAPLHREASANLWERRDRVHAGDSAFLRTVAPLVRAANTAVAPRQLTVASEQAGMVTYYLQQAALAAGHPIRFIDQLGLADDTWNVCRNGIAATQLGKFVPVSRMLSGQCGPLPDIYFDIFQPPPELTTRYVIVYAQRGTITTSRPPDGAYAPALEVLAIRRDLLTGPRSAALRSALNAIRQQ